MIVSIVTFKLPTRWTVTEAATVFKSTAPKYLDMPGLLRKHYYITEAGDRAGGIYFLRPTLTTTPRSPIRFAGKIVVLCRLQGPSQTDGSAGPARSRRDLEPADEMPKP